MEWLVGLCSLLGLLQCAVAQFTANAIIMDANGLRAGQANRIGIITFRQDAGSKLVYVGGNISSLNDGQHGFHVHQTGDISNGCDSALGHFNPENLDHGAPTDKIRHVGDLGNVRSSFGRVNVEITDDVISLYGRHSIIGRTLVIHRDQDDLGRGNFPDSKTTGHAGPRVGCGIIGLVSGAPALAPLAALLVSLLALLH